MPGSVRGAGLTPAPARRTSRMRGSSRGRNWDLLMLVIEVDDTDLRRAATVYLSTLSGEARRPRVTAKTHANTSRPAPTGPTAPARPGGRSRWTRTGSARRHAVQRGRRSRAFSEGGHQTAPDPPTPRRRAHWTSAAGTGQGGRGRSVLLRACWWRRARVVKHPGTKPRFYIAAEAARTEPLLHTATSALLPTLLPPDPVLDSMASSSPPPDAFTGTPWTSGT